MSSSKLRQAIHFLGATEAKLSQTPDMIVKRGWSSWGFLVVHISNIFKIMLDSKH